MNRLDRRASDAKVRQTGQVSPSLLQAQLVRVEQERQLYQDLLWGILRAQGRVRVRKQDMEGRQGERLDVREVGDDLYLTIEEIRMVSPNGIKDGKPVEGGDSNGHGAA